MIFVEHLQYAEPQPMAPLDLLAIAAHPDDVEQTCGGTLLRMAERGYRTGVMDLTAGEMGTRGTPETRLEESREAGRRLRLAWRGNCRMPDARLENTIMSRMTVAGVIRQVRPRVVILPYWEARHPDHCRACELGYEGSFLAGLKKLDEDTPAHRPYKVLYSVNYARVQPAFVVDITAQFARRMEALFAYRSQYEDHGEGSAVFPPKDQVRERLEMVARYYGSLIGVKYGEGFAVKEALAVDDVVAMGARSF
jgi:N-acetylglucosamine malate deacetylase 1